MINFHLRFSPFGISSPILDPTTNKISGFVGGNGGRKFPIDMAGFATSLRYIKFYHDYKIVHIFYPDHIPTIPYVQRLIHQKRPVMPYKSTFEEEGYISSLKIK